MLMGANWLQVREAFDEVVEESAENRAAALDRACGSDKGLRLMVESMLRAYEASPHFLEGLTSHDEVDWAPKFESGDEFGSVTIIRFVAGGGQGEVYEAQQREPARRVAIKILSAAALDPERAAAFRDEVNAMGRLEHPCIARIYATERAETRYGRLSAIVMEFVDGETLTEHCRGLRLGLRDRVKLLLRVCEAIEFAHRHNVVHCDLKPSNVLVHPDGLPRILDFGIARLLGDAVGEAGSDSHLGFEGTLGYVSPERTVTGRTSPQCDVYALGLMLYELAADRPARDIQELSTQEAVERIRTQDPTPLRQVNPSVPKDLEKIVERAMARDPAHRYASVTELANHLNLYLEGRPLPIRPVGPLEAALMFSRRNRGPVLAAAAIVLLLVGGLIATGLQAVRATRAEQRAEQRFNDVRELARQMIFDLSYELDDLPGSTKARQMVAETGLAYLRRLSVGMDDDLDLAFEVATGMHRVAGLLGSPTQANVGDFAQSAVVYAETLALAEGHLQRSSDDPRWLRLLIAVLIEYGTAQVMGAMGDDAGALLAFEKADAYTRRLGDNLSMSDLRHFSEISRQRLSQLQRMGRGSEAPAVLVAAEALVEGHPPPDAVAEDWYHYSCVQSGLGMMYQSLGDAEEALRLYGAAGTSADVAERLDRTTPLYRQQQLNVHRYRASQYAALKEWEACIEQCRRAMAIRNALLEELEVTMTIEQIGAVILMEWAKALFRSGDVASGNSRAEEAIAILGAQHQREPGNFHAHRNIVASYLDLANTADIVGADERLPLSVRRAALAQSITYWRDGIGEIERMLESGLEVLEIESAIARYRERMQATEAALARMDEELAATRSE